MVEKKDNYYVAILRGINVSGKNMIKMPALVKLFEQIGCKDVKTYVQSGNVIFKHPLVKTKDFEKQIRELIEKELNLKVPVIIFEENYLQKVKIDNPFVIENDIDLSKLHVTFLSDEPTKENAAKISADQFLPDEFVIDKKVIYLHCPVSYGNTKLTNNYFENKLKVTATTRNWKTVNALAELVSAG